MNETGLIIRGIKDSQTFVSIICCCCLAAVATLHNPTNCSMPISLKFSRQKCQSGQPFPSPWDLPNPGIKPRSLALRADSLVQQNCIIQQLRCLHMLSTFTHISMNLYIYPIFSVCLSTHIFLLSRKFHRKSYDLNLNPRQGLVCKDCTSIKYHT